MIQEPSHKYSVTLECLYREATLSIPSLTVLALGRIGIDKIYYLQGNDLYILLVSPARNLLSEGEH